MAFEVPHRAMLLACFVSVVAALGGCADAELEPAPVARSTAAPTSVSPAAPAQADAGDLGDGAPSASSDGSPVEADTALAEPDHDGGPLPRTDEPDGAPSPGATWGCVEGGGVCDCYDAHLTDRYIQPTCVEVYPCCVRFAVTGSDGDTFSGCDCYSDAYLEGTGRTCLGQIDRIHAIAIYSSAELVARCPAR